MNIPVSHCLRCGKWFKEDGDALCPKCLPERTAQKTRVFIDGLVRGVGPSEYYG